MPRFAVNGVFYEAPNYAAAAQMHRAAQAGPLQPAPVVPVLPPPIAFTTALAPVDNFAGRSATQFGIGEEIDLSFNTVPAQNAAFFGGLQWAVKSGPGVLSAVTQNGTARLTMGSMPGNVVLELRTVALPVTVKATKTLWSMEPSSAVIVQQAGTGIYHRQGQASAGFKGEIQMRPTNISFYRCEFREGTAPIRATGSMNITVSTLSATSESTGQGAATRQELANLAGARHPVMGSWIPLSRGSNVTGSVMLGNDTINAMPMNPPFAAGTFDWEINWFIRVIGSPTEKHFYTVTHSEVVTATGQMTMSKGGHSVTCQAADGNSNF